MRCDNRFIETIPQLRRYARFLTHDVSAAEDLVQDCLVQGISKLHLWKRGTDLRAWLSTILYHQYINQLRRAARERRFLGEFERESPSSYKANQDARLELLDIGRAFDRLPAAQRTVLLQVGVREIPTGEIAKASGIPVKTVRTRLFRGRAKLHRELDAPETVPAPWRVAGRDAAMRSRGF